MPKYLCNEHKWHEHLDASQMQMEMSKKWWR